MSDSHSTTNDTNSIQFRDLQRQYERIKPEIDKAVADVILSAHFISGPQVRELESTLASYVGVKHCISCANGTDAISIALMAHGIGPGDAVFVPDFTFFSSGECPATIGATPIFVDVDLETYNIDSDSLIQAIEAVLAEGELRPKAVVAVDLFGQPFNVPAIHSICDKYGMLLLEDAAQGFGGSYTDDKGTKYLACNLGTISTTSFFPAKPFGCYGDGGAIFTDDDRIALLCRSIAVHGKDTENLEDPYAKYNNIRLGMNSRLDTLQAGVLLAKFPLFRDFELDNVNKVASMYSELLKDITGLTIPIVGNGYFSSWADYTIQLPRDADRSKIQSELQGAGIPTNILYIRPMHKQKAFKNTRSAIADCPVTEDLCNRVLCLPIHPYLTDDEVLRICSALKNAI